MNSKTLQLLSVIVILIYAFGCFGCSQPALAEDEETPTPEPQKPKRKLTLEEKYSGSDLRRIRELQEQLRENKRKHPEKYGLKPANKPPTKKDPKAIHYEYSIDNVSFIRIETRNDHYLVSIYHFDHKVGTTVFYKSYKVPINVHADPTKFSIHVNKSLEDSFISIKSVKSKNVTTVLALHINVQDLCQIK